MPGASSRVKRVRQYFSNTLLLSLDVVLHRTGMESKTTQSFNPKHLDLFSCEMCSSSGLFWRSPLFKKKSRALELACVLQVVCASTLGSVLKANKRKPSYISKGSLLYDISHVVTSY